MPSARLLDLTRLVSRLGRGQMTGIDRVEMAYLARLLAEPAPLFGLVRSAAGWLLLDGNGCSSLAALVENQALLQPADFLSRLLHRTNPLRARAESAARKLAIARATRLGLARLLRRLPKEARYINVGHSNLTERSLATLQQAGFSVSVMIHDTIPLDHPEFARPDTVEPFRAKLAAVSAHATRVIHISRAAQALTEAQLAKAGRVPPAVVAPIGTLPPLPDPAGLPPGLELTSPYFVALGTIEPRKNHVLLLDVWNRLPAPAPRLFIIGGRGWADAALMSRLDALPADGPVQVLQGLDDGAVALMLSKACALLAPSLAEGFGLPPVEAALLGTPVIATDLAVTREILGNNAVYLSPTDIYSWMETISRQARCDRNDMVRSPSWTAPTWGDHFKTVLSLT